MRNKLAVRVSLLRNNSVTIQTKVNNVLIDALRPSSFRVMPMKILWTFALLVCASMAVSANEPLKKPVPIPVGLNIMNELRNALKNGTPKEKEVALDMIRALKPIALIPDVIEAIEDPTVLPDDVSAKCKTGWGFVGHQATTVLGEIARVLDGVEIGMKPNMRGYKPYSFHDDQSEGSKKLKESGRLAEVKKNWAKWWDEQRK
jgi:hypothetical protein